MGSLRKAKGNDGGEGPTEVEAGPGGPYLGKGGFAGQVSGLGFGKHGQVAVVWRGFGDELPRG